MFCHVGKTHYICSAKIREVSQNGKLFKNIFKIVCRFGKYFVSLQCENKQKVLTIKADFNYIWILHQK
jgi:hypothetical protein